MPILPKGQVLEQIPLPDNFDSILSNMKHILNSAQCAGQAHEAVRSAFDLVEAKGALTWVRIVIDNDVNVTLERESFQEVFHINSAIKCLPEPKLAMISVITLGDKIDKEARRLNDQGDFLLSYLLDLAGVILLCKTCKSIRRHALDEARKMGWGLGPSIGPGSIPGWDLKDQKRFCLSLPLKSIGVSINESSGFLIPLKSVSSMVAIGPGYKYKGFEGMCSFCNSSVRGCVQQR